MLLAKPSIGRIIAAVDAEETTAAKSVPNSSLEARRSWREDQYSIVDLQPVTPVEMWGNLWGRPLRVEEGFWVRCLAIGDLIQVSG